MGRPKSRSDEEVVAAAWRAVGRHGPATFTIRQVAAEAGLSPAAIMQRFGSKARLMAALRADGADLVRRAFDEATAGHADPRRALVEALASCASSVARGEDMANHVAFLAMDLADEEGRRQTRTFFRLLHTNIGTLVARALDPDDRQQAERTTDSIEAAYHGALLSAAVYGKTPAEHVRRRVEQACAAHLRPPRPAQG